jgi:hypothetical protein
MSRRDLLAMSACYAIVAAIAWIVLVVAPRGSL